MSQSQENDAWNHHQNARTNNEDFSLYDDALHHPEPRNAQPSFPDAPRESWDSGYETGSKSTDMDMEDEYMYFSELETSNDARGASATLSQELNELVSSPIRENNVAPSDVCIGSLFRRTLSLQSPVTNSTASNSRIRQTLFAEHDEELLEAPLTSELGVGLKRPRMCDDDEDGRVPEVKRHFSVNEEKIMSAVQRSCTEPDLIGDFSKNFCLPLTESKHQDLKAVSPVTLARLVKGEFDDVVASFKIIDCRYPYEFHGGHIDGAVNIYTREQCTELLAPNVIPNNASEKRHILIFHCEFSSKRGPNLYRHLRREDRQRNASAYPSLSYPEIYLLKGGYKSFFENFSELCTPEGYTEMLNPGHKEDLKHFRQKSRTWNCESQARLQGRRIF